MNTNDISIYNYLTLLVLLFLSAAFSGLTIGYSSLNSSDLRRKAKLGDKDAEKILKIRSNINLLLSTLLFGNVAVNSAIPLYLDSIMGSVVESSVPYLMMISPKVKFISTTLIAGFTSTFLILIFGEVFPNAVTKKHAMKIGSLFYPLMRLTIWIFYPVCYPLSKLLDWLVGKEGTTLFQKDEIAEMIKEHEQDNNSPIDKDEEDIIIGALTFSDKKAKEVMTTKRNLFLLNQEIKLTKEIMLLIKNRGFTRIPVYKDTEDNIVGILYSKDLIGMIDDDKKVIDYMRNDKVYTTTTDTKLDYLLNKMSRRTHMAIVYDEDKTLRGVLTLEDIIEEILDRDILDETDTQEDMNENTQSIEIKGKKL